MSHTFWFWIALVLLVIASIAAFFPRKWFTGFLLKAIYVVITIIVVGSLFVMWKTWPRGMENDVLECKGVCADSVVDARNDSLLRVGKQKGADSATQAFAARRNADSLKQVSADSAAQAREDELRRKLLNGDRTTTSVQDEKPKRILAIPKQSDTATIWWKHWGAAPYASSYESVCKNMPSTIQGFRRMPAEVKQEFIRMLGTNCAGGEEIYITPDMRFWEMMTGGAKPYPMQNVAVDKVAVKQSRDGRPLREVFQTARGRKWTVEHEGRTYTLVIPYVCYNVAYMVSDNGCVTVAFDAYVDGTVSFIVGSVEGPLPPDKCNSTKQGSGERKAWYGECPSCEPSLVWMRQILGDNVTVPHRYQYRVIAKRQEISFSRAIYSRGLQICITTPEGMKSCGLGIAPGNTALTWNNRTFIWIDWSLWKWNNNCSD